MLTHTYICKSLYVYSNVYSLAIKVIAMHAQQQIKSIYTTLCAYAWYINEEKTQQQQEY